MKNKKKHYPKNARHDPDEMRSDYSEKDLKNGVRGKYYGRVKDTIMILLEPDIAEYFPNADSVNETLRKLIELTPKKITKKIKISKEAIK